MTQIGNRHQVSSLQVLVSQISEIPIVLSLSQPGSVDGRPVTQKMNPHFLNEIEVPFPLSVMTAFFHFVDAYSTLFNGRIRILDTGRKQERERHLAGLPGRDRNN